MQAFFRKYFWGFDALHRDDVMIQLNCTKFKEKGKNS
jgi:hypothetical protein